MPAQDTSQIKEKIIFILKKRGPSLPVHIAQETGLSILFSSAFLSELIADKKIKTSNLRVGSSPLYLIPGQEFMLANFSQYLKSKEKDAFILLKEKKFLKDLEQDPAIRVALRSIRDFAMAFKKDDEIFWRYFTIPENDFKEGELKLEPQKIVIEPETAQENKPEIEKEIIKEEQEQKTKTEQSTPKELDIFEETQKQETVKKPKEKSMKKNISQKKNDKFFNQVKEHLADKSIEILDIVSFSKEDLILKIKIKEETQILVAYNKKKISEEDIIKANKKASELNMRYTLLSKGEPLKRTINLIESIKNLSKIEKME